MQPIILVHGPIPLTQEAADAALDTIDFIAAAVRGYDAIDVTNIVRPLWRTHLSYWYPQLAPWMQQWYANAPQMLASIRTQWTQLDPWSRSAILQQWAMDLPAMLWMVDPVLAQAQAIELQESQRSRINEWRGLAAAGQPSQTLSEAQAIKELNEGMENAVNMQNFSTQMNVATLNWMHAMSGGSGNKWTTR